MSRSLAALLALSALLFFVPFAASAALININTAGTSELESLPGIGPSKAAAIIRYRSDHGSFATIADIENVSGIGPVTFANLEPFITVDSTSEASSAATTTPDSGRAAEYTPPPLPGALALTLSGDRAALLNVPAHFSALVKTNSGVASSASISWAFGDGSSGTGSVAEKTYRYPGTYAVEASAQDGEARASGELVVVVRAAQVRLDSVSGEGITIANDADSILDLSGWALAAGGEFFTFPSGTKILAHASVLFPSTITGLSVRLDDTALLYPGRSLAAHYEPYAPDASYEPALPIPTQPPISGAGSYSVQTVEPALTSQHVPSNETTTVAAPRAVANTPTARGAATSSLEAGPAAAGVAKSLMRSPWTYGLLGVLLLSGGAFMIL